MQSQAINSVFSVHIQRNHSLAGATQTKTTDNLKCKTDTKQKIASINKYVPTYSQIQRFNQWTGCKNIDNFSIQITRTHIHHQFVKHFVKWVAYVSNHSLHSSHTQNSCACLAGRMCRCRWLKQPHRFILLQSILPVHRIYI